MLCAALAALVFSLAATGASAASIDYGSLFVGKHAPAGTMKKLRRAARLALRSSDCASVSGGFYVPPASQMQAHRGKPYMIMCRFGSGSGYNAYFSDADLASGQTHGAPKAVPRRRAILLCARMLRRQYPGISLHATQTAYDASPSTGNAAVRIGATVPTIFGGHLDLVGSCTVTPGGHLSARDVGLLAPR